MAALKRVTRVSPDLRIKVGLLAVHQGRAVRVVGIHSGGRIHLKVEGTAEFVWTDVSMIAPYVVETPQKTIRAPSDGDPEKERQAVRWSEVLGRLTATCDGTVRKADLIQVAGEMGVSPKTVRRRLKAYRDNPIPASQLTSTPGPCVGSRRLLPLVESLIDAAIEEVHLTRERRPLVARREPRTRGRVRMWVLAPMRR